MTDFSHLKKLDVHGRTADMPLYNIGGTPVLIMVSAMQDNKPYVNAVLKSTSRQMRRLQRGNLTQDMLDAEREQDRRLFPRHVIVGWRDVVDANGEDVPFSPADCEEFLRALPDYVVDEIKAFANTPANFLDAENLIDEEALEKN